MSSFYTNVSISGKYIQLRGYEDGKRISRQIPFSPYIFLPSKTPTEFKTINGKFVQKVEFEDPWAARNWMKQYKDVEGFEYYGFDKWPYVFIHDNYKGDINYDTNLIRVLGIDIEVDTEGGNPDLAIANKEITAVAFRYKNKRIALAYHEWPNPPEGVTYIRCKDEVELLHRFLDIWKKIDPDILTGWNIEKFDIPYVVRRLEQVLGEDFAKQLSPCNRLIEKVIETFGKEITVYNPVGISILDYMDLYKKFTYSQEESYALDNIAFVQLKERKVDYKTEYGSLANLYKQNFPLFMEYNVKDIDLVFRIDEKMRLIELILAMAYDAKTNYNDALTTVLYWDVLIYNYLGDQGIVVPKYSKKMSRPFAGGYVKDPLIGMHDWVMSFDLTSLYPHLIMQYNIGVETFAKKLSGVEVDDLMEGKLPDIPEGHTLAANGCLFRKDVQSFASKLMELKFKQRVEAKNKMLDFKRRKEAGEQVDNEISRYNNAQQAKKIQLNAFYGALTNEAFRYFFVDIGEAVTLSGQLSIKWVAKRLNDLVNELTGTTGVDYVIAMDTDSCYLNFGPYVKAKGLTEGIIDHLDDLSKNVVQKTINKAYEELAEQQQVYQNAMKMKREAIGDRAIWVAKKRYMMNVWDNEDVRFKEPELKTMGIETVRSSTPAICRTALKESIKIIMTENVESLRSYIDKFKKTYYTSSFQDIAFPRGINGIEKWSDKATLYKSGTPIHVRAALVYNKMLKDRGMRDITPIYDGDKIKFAYMKLPNPMQENVMASHDTIPEDLRKYVDYTFMFEKAFQDPIKNILEVIGWELEPKATLGDLF